MTTVRKRQDEKRRQKLAEVRRQVAEGSLVIRQMTATERKQNPPAQRKPKKGK
jgi:hypothetical protein